MGWDPKQKRWRAMYKRVPLQIRASKLGGTNYADTVVAANQWLEKEKSKIDQELALENPRPNQIAYIAELQSIQSDIKTLSALVRNPAHSSLIPVLDVLKHKESGIKRVLQQEILPPLDDTLRNPRHISPERLEEEAIQDAKQELRNEVAVLHSHESRMIREIDGKEYIVTKVRLPKVTVNGIVYSEPQERMTDVEELIDKRLTKIVKAKDKALADKKREVGVVGSERELGKLDQMLDEHGVAVPESLLLDYHIDRFLDTQRRRCAERKISAGRLGKINSTIETYRKWSSIVRVDKIGTKDHIDGYYDFLSQRVVAGKIKGKYANNLFADFRMMIDWLFKEEVLKTYPVCLQRKGDDYRFHVVRQKPKGVDLQWVHKILATAEPRMRLCILLTLNCGFGASEIGQLTKEEYDPATGRITHKRCKTQKYANAPTVCYRLWDETKALLDQEIANNKKKYPKAKYLLVNNNGNPLWNEYVGDDGKTHKSDNITCAFKRLVIKLQASDPEFPSIAYYQFRKTSATLIFNEPEYMGLDWLWLGHAPKTTAGQHYTAPTPTILDKCLARLHDIIFDPVSLSEPIDVKTDKV